MEERAGEVGRAVREAPHITEILNALPYGAGILDSRRRIVAANTALTRLFRRIEPANSVGFSPGELLGCIHATETPDGCGSSSFCKVCGLLTAVRDGALGSEGVTREWRVTARDGDRLVPYDLQITASPFRFHGADFALVSILDVSGEKRRQALERIFFHDILNTAGGVKSLLEMLRHADTREEADVLRRELERAVETLLGEITTQRELSAAERGELAVHSVPVSALRLLRDAAELFFHHPVAEGKSIDILAESEEFILVVDEVLAKRILGNMLKNALEASQPGDRISLSCGKEGDRAFFTVHNHGFIDEHVALQIFQRSFSTKGGGRGLGTYGMKLLGETYLRGKVDFSSAPEGGTVFRLELPLEGGAP